MKVLLFGTGDFYRQYRSWFPKEDVVALLDNESRKQGQLLDGYPVVSPAEGVRMTYDAVFLLSMYYQEMRTQLLSLGVPSEKIFGLSDIGRFVQADASLSRVKQFASPCKAGRDSKRIAILLSDLYQNGASIAAMVAAETLAGAYDVTVLSATDGPLRASLSAAGVDVWIAPILQIATMADVSWMADFNLVFCNTFRWYAFLSRRDVRQPIVWWLHDSASFYRMTDHAVLRHLDTKHLQIFSVGPLARKAIQSFLPKAEIVDFLYGIPDVLPPYRTPIPHKMVRFAVIGAIQPHKGQDLFLQAVQKLSEDLRKKAEFFIIGDDTTALANEVRIRMKNFPEVHIKGELDRNTLLNVYREIDVLVCPSREDTMSIVATEAMMFSHPCIVSDHVGICQYIQDGVNSVIYPVDDTQALADALADFIQHPSKIVAMGRCARKVYEEVFSMPRFQRNILQLVENVIENQGENS